MTNSSDNAPVEKKSKAKGPIRTGAVVPALVLTILIGVYFSFFFDSNLRRLLEYVGTQVNGAEVDIGHLSTSFLHANLDIRNIQVTDKNHPERNIVQVGSIHFKMLWDALLRAKVVVDDASILNIQALSPRKRPGYVVPPAPPGKDQGPSLIDQAQDQVLSQTRKQFNGNFLSDIASVLGGTDPKEQLKNLQGNLKSDARIKELEKDFNEKKAKWEKQIKDLPQAQDIKQFETRIKALKFDTKNPAEFAKNVSEAQKILKEADAKVKLVDQASKDIKGEVNTYSQAMKDLEKTIQEDVGDLQKRLKLPNVDAKEFSQQLFMGMIEQKIVGVRKYIEVARKYMPAKQTAAEKQAAAEKKKQEELVPPKRGQGKSYRFPITTGYPLFWLKHAAISSELGSSEYGGNIKGEIKDVTTDQAYIGRPTLILAKGDFPKQNIFDLDSKITLDHRTEQAKDSILVHVGRFPLAETKLSDSPDVKLALAKADGTSDMEASLIDEKIKMEIKSSFSNVKYDLEAKNGTVKEIIGAVLNGIPKLTLNADIQGSFKDFAVHINSNLGEELSNGFKKQLQAKVDQAKAELHKMIDSRIGSERDKLKSEIDKSTGGITKELDGKKAEVDKIMNQAKQEANGGKQGGTKNLEEQGKKLLKGLFGH